MITKNRKSFYLKIYLRERLYIFDCNNVDYIVMVYIICFVDFYYFNQLDI